MKKLVSNGWLAVIVIVSLLVIDQVIKIGVKTNMYLYESIRITDWFYIHFIENNGMAYGMTFVNKLVLSTFRIVAVAVILYYLRGQILKGARTGYIVCLSMVVAGAAGNIFDSMFYGLQRFVTVLRKLPCSFRSRLCLVPYGQGSRYVLLPHNRDDATRVASRLGWSALCVLQPCIQLCRCLYMCCCGAVAAVLP